MITVGVQAKHYRLWHHVIAVQEAMCATCVLLLKACSVKAQFLLYRLTLSGLTVDEAENVDRAWIRSLKWMSHNDTMRSLLQRVSIHNALLSWYWSDSQLKKVLGDSLTSYMEAAPMGIISLLKKDHPNPVSQRYSYLLARENWTWPELQAKFALEPLVFATPSPKKATSFPSDRQHAPDVPGDDHGDSDGNVPLYYRPPRSRPQLVDGARGARNCVPKKVKWREEPLRPPAQMR